MTLPPSAPAPGTVLCALADIADPGAKGFDFGGGTARFLIFVVRRGAILHGWVNECPHQQTPLELFPDQFLTRDGGHILCTTHGARFRLHDGYCVRGPCGGKSLQPFAVRVEGGMVVCGSPA